LPPRTLNISNRIGIESVQSHARALSPSLRGPKGHLTSTLPQSHALPHILAPCKLCSYRKNLLQTTHAVRTHSCKFLAYHSCKTMTDPPVSNEHNNPKATEDNVDDRNGKTAEDAAKPAGNETPSSGEKRALPNRASSHIPTQPHA